MQDHNVTRSAEGAAPRRVLAFNGGLLSSGRVRRIMTLAGYAPRLGRPRKGDLVAIWGNSPTAWRGQAIARRSGAGLLRVEDAFLRSILPGRARGRIARRGPVGLLIDPVGLHFDPSRPSLIETLAMGSRAEALQSQAAQAMARLMAADLSKYNHHVEIRDPPPHGYVLVIDQTAGDASLLGAGRPQFLDMLGRARAENPDLPLLIRTHPETASGLRPGHFSTADLRDGEAICDAPISPWTLLRGAAQVYVWSSQMGYEAILAGHRPHVFGTPFYAGWGLSEDRQLIARRRPVSVQTLFAASHLLAPHWYDPCRDRLTDFEGALRQIEAEARAWRQDHAGHIAHGMRLWKRPALARFFGSAHPLRFSGRQPEKATLVWASRSADSPAAIRVEDGFLRSRGLGAALVPPLSLVADDLGIYYDPHHPSRLEDLIAAPLPPGGAARARILIRQLKADGITKYNLSGPMPDLPAGHRILVPGQVGDDASIRLGTGAGDAGDVPVTDNLALLHRVRRDNPDAVIIYKPHPDVEAGLRSGAIPTPDSARLADVVASGVPAAALLYQVDEVWTMTSTLGFEALLRGVPVTVLGAPFYAGWGLTQDLGGLPETCRKRRQARPDLLHLAHAVLIDYPRYFDPLSGLPCPVEVVLDRLGDPSQALRSGPALRILTKLQGLMAGHAWLWRR